MLLSKRPTVLLQTVPEFFNADEAADYCRLTARGAAVREVCAEIVSVPLVTMYSQP